MKFIEIWHSSSPPTGGEGLGERVFQFHTQSSFIKKNSNMRFRFAERLRTSTTLSRPPGTLSPRERGTILCALLNLRRRYVSHQNRAFNPLAQIFYDSPPPGGEGLGERVCPHDFGSLTGVTFPPSAPFQSGEGLRFVKDGQCGQRVILETPP